MNSTSHTARLKLLWRGFTQRASLSLTTEAFVGHLSTFSQAIVPLTKEVFVSTTAIWSCYVKVNEGTCTGRKVPLRAQLKK